MSLAFVAPAVNGMEEPLNARRDLEMSTLRRRTEALLRSSRSKFVLGRNTQVEELALNLGLWPDDYCTFDVETEGQLACLVCVPTRVWRSSESMSALRKVKSAAADLGYFVLLVPESFIRAHGRSTGSIAGYLLDYEINGSDRAAILQHMLEHGASSLGTLAGLLRHPDPVGAILHLVTVGVLDIDLSAPIIPAAQVRFHAQ